jgi:hypothetical protein
MEPISGSATTTAGRVRGIDERHGTLDVEHLRRGARIILHVHYVAHHVRLAYATTIAAAQGLTVDETHVVVTPAMYRSELYTALSRGRNANHTYAIWEPDAEDAHSGTGPSTPTEIVARVARRERPDWAAHSVLRRATNPAEHPDVIRARMLEVIRTLQRMREGPERDALDAYRNRLAAVGRTIEPPPAPPITQPARSLALSPRQRGLSIDL